MRIDCYLWGEQCPYNAKIREILSELDQKRYDVRITDVSGDFRSAEYVSMYSPTLLVFDGKYRWNGPITGDIIGEIAATGAYTRKPFAFALPEEVYRGELLPLTPDSVAKTAHCCSHQRQEGYCSGKAAFMARIIERYGLPHLGYLHMKSGLCVGGAEFAPSTCVPYAIPRAEDTAFLTCVFGSDPTADYKAHPLEHLESDLPNLGFREAICVVSEDVYFPNGTLRWFLDRGYEDRGILFHEPGEYARMHLAGKTLSSEKAEP